MARTSSHILRIESTVRLTQEGRFQNVPTLTILQKPALVQIHLLTRCLEVQSNWRKQNINVKTCRPPETMSISLPTGGASVGEQLVTVLYFTFCLLLLKIEQHIKKCSHQFDSLHSTFPEGYSWRNGGAGLRGRSCSSGDCCDEQNTPLNLENKKSSTHFALSLCS